MSLELHRLTKRYGDRLLFTELSYRFPDRGIVAITGASGTGKTTLLRMIAGLDNAYQGEIRGRGRLSVAFQEYRLFPSVSAVDNVALGLPDAREAAGELLGTLGFTPEDCQKRPRALSGGMQQRVALARALLHPAELLLLDEATKEMDAALVGVVHRLIREAAERQLVLLVTHRAEDITALDADILSLSPTAP